MEEKTKVDTVVSPTETEPSQEKDPVQAELDRVEAQPKKSKLEKLEYTEKRIKQQISEEKAKAGIVEDDEDRPLTVREYRSIQQEEAQSTAISLAGQIENEAERKLTQYHLENTIKPSGDAQTDLRNARLLVNAVKNSQITEEALRTTKVRTTGSGAGAPPKEKQTTELTKEERDYAKAFQLSDAQVIAARPKE